MILAFVWSLLIAHAGAKQLRSKVLEPPSRAYLSESEYQHHRGNEGTLVASTSSEKPAEVLIGSSTNIAIDALKEHSNRTKSYDVCEEETDHKCTRRNCKTNDSCAAFGKIKRVTRGNVPEVSGNSPGSYCAVSEKYEFIFVHVLKNAGSSTKRWFREATNCPEDKHPCAVEMMNCMDAMLAHPNYFRWTWARHPFDRALSIYAMAKAYNLDPSVSFADFWLAGQDRWDMTQLCADHAEPQARFMLDPQGCLAVDYVANLENAATEWPHILEMIGSKKLINYQQHAPFMQPEEGNVFGTTEADSAGVENGRELVLQNETLSQHLLKEFELDFDLMF